uniref:Uncharacterized protein n=1 Tax=Entomoneis paludosa TaxID=265537 RepID=A0A7S2VCL4_9STRA|mmetsp:Transcript_16377/g.33816  ORF Transcript_16377/g.33816 Transcript_16377/m.33816 type:complete len:134 (+) Transcript_16377:417-818(+)|eukprot:CAMPEP_0172459894 /NCGR_PEP_ID=MMETSP1065-20121228/34568_1 /TAXON_ID=265537 /ORGANISM="Amphiprora paludosa, Strain CCMP125" /LENGTH=133 /DNA_ID=CAMNT_0013214743 /DNA_START=239 /DNA_END=640 /DNA_ORIENTATION=-
METKQKALDLYAILTRRRPSNLSHIARQPIALEGLVRSASLQYGASSPLRHAAVSILLGMAEDPCHHRIMAKQTGLLSLLIRYVREQESSLHVAVAAASSSPPRRNQEEVPMNVSSPDRELIKANIMHIAAAL